MISSWDGIHKEEAEKETELCFVLPYLLPRESCSLGDEGGVRHT